VTLDRPTITAIAAEVVRLLREQEEQEYRATLPIEEVKRQQSLKLKESK
jgi:hypothetical protein